MQELIDHFSLERVSKSGARFDFEKAKWFNHEYLVNKTDDEVAEMFMPALEEKGISCDFAKAKHIVSLVKSRVNFVKELWDQCSFFFESPAVYDEKSVKKRWKPESSAQMSELSEILKNISDFSAANTEKAVMSHIESKGYNLGGVMNAFRIAIVGESKGPHIFDITEIIGKEETISRLEKAIAKVG